VKKRFLRKAQKQWLAKLFQNLIVVLVAAIAGGEFFLKVSLRWRLLVLAGLIASFWLGLSSAVEVDNENKEA